MNTHNYDVALQSINKIKSPSAEILKAKQKILYRLGVQEFINGDMNKSIEFMMFIAVSGFILSESSFKSRFAAVRLSSRAISPLPIPSHRIIA